MRFFSQDIVNVDVLALHLLELSNGSVRGRSLRLVSLAVRDEWLEEFVKGLGPKSFMTLPQ